MPVLLNINRGSEIRVRGTIDGIMELGLVTAVLLILSD